MKQKDYRIAKELKNRISKAVNLVDYRVFGSRARGIADKYSDMDVFAEVGKINKKTREKIFDIAWEVGLENYLVVSLFVFTRREIENTPLRSSPFIRNIFNDGVSV